MGAQIRVDGKTNEHKAALKLLGVLPLVGPVVTGDAMFCQKGVRRAVTEGGGEYLFTVKDNQPTLHYDIACLFGESAAFPPPPPTGKAGGRLSRTLPRHYKGHGWVETRTLRATLALSKYLSAWPGVAQVLQLHRVRRFPGGRFLLDTPAGLTRLRPLDAGASRLLCLNRTYWSIESNPHRVRDAIFGEDASHIRSGHGPQILAVIRNALTHLSTHRRHAPQLRRPPTNRRSTTRSPPARKHGLRLTED